MNLQSKYPTTPDEFLRWNEGREGKREFVNGRVVEMMINVTRNHWVLCSRLVLQLMGRLDGGGYYVGSADFGVRTSDGVRFPDVLVEAAGGDGMALATEAPLLLAEVLSKSSMHDDFGPKARDYQGLPSLQHYLIFAQDEIRAWLWSRAQDGSWPEPVIFEAGTIPLSIDGAPISIDLSALYAGIAAVQTQ